LAPQQNLLLPSALVLVVAVSSGPIFLYISGIAVSAFLGVFCYLILRINFSSRYKATIQYPGTKKAGPFQRMEKMR
jgi:hypothetical protein